MTKTLNKNRQQIYLTSLGLALKRLFCFSKKSSNKLTNKGNTLNSKKYNRRRGKVQVRPRVKQKPLGHTLTIDNGEELKLDESILKDLIVRRQLLMI
ncbi:hypothetical protein ABH968_001257 [Lysinibacillus sp. RC79]